jgi:excisionase family DNA binding protein
MQIQEEMISSGEAARLLDVSQSTVGRLCEGGLLSAWRVGDGGWWRISLSSVLKYRELNPDERRLIGKRIARRLQTPERVEGKPT